MESPRPLRDLRAFVVQLDGTDALLAQRQSTPLITERSEARTLHGALREEDGKDKERRGQGDKAKGGRFSLSPCPLPVLLRTHWKLNWTERRSTKPEVEGSNPSQCASCV